MATVAVTASSGTFPTTSTMSDTTRLHGHGHDLDSHDSRSESTSTNTLTRPSRSRENTPSTLSSHSLDTVPLDRTTSSASTSITNGEGSGSSLGQASQETQSDAGVERFLQKIDMEKKMQALQQRLELASVKASNGWTDMTINEIEKQRLTPKSARRTSSHLTIHPTPPTSARLPYEPPSPSRPWQLMDVLWQPLPPPSNGRYPMSPISPSSPRKRSRDEYGDQPSARSIFQYQQQQRPVVPMHGSAPTHRRSSSTAFMASASPLRQFKEGEKKKRSHSHSTHTTRQDVDAAKALTFMLGSGNEGPGSGSQSPNRAMFGPPLGAATTTSLPKRENSGSSGEGEARGRAHSELIIPPRRQGKTPPRNAEADDKAAADLMLFLAHSPSPVTRVKPSPNRMNEVKGAARVLFQDPEPKDIKEPRLHSNLASAPPINNDTEMGDEIVAVEKQS